MPSLISWIKASRLRTLPLALAVTGMGNLIVFRSPHFRWEVGILSIITTVLLQILSNLANDYGDSIHGADLVDRKGPSRTVQNGEISKETMLKAIVLVATFSFVVGSVLLYFSFASDLSAALPFLALGILAIGAAYFYTNGSRPYGYQALGDVSVFVFFGLVGVLGTSYLHTQSLAWVHLLPAITMGCWSTAVLNINNMRDMQSDKAAGKETIPLKLGLQKARLYHTGLVLSGFIALLSFGWIESDFVWLGILPGGALVLLSLQGVWQTEMHDKLDRYLKPQALGTFLAVAGVWIADLLVR